MLLAGHLGIVLGNHLGHIVHGSERNLDCVPVDGGPEDVVGGEAGVDDTEEGGSNVSFHRLVERWVKPSHSPFSAPPLWLAVLVLQGGVVGQLVLVASLVQRLLVGWDGVVKDGLAGGEAREPPVHTVGNVPDDAGRMVAVHVDVADAVPRLVVRPEGPLGQVERHIQEVYLSP